MNVIAYAPVSYARMVNARQVFLDALRMWLATQPAPADVADEIVATREAMRQLARLAE